MFSIIILFYYAYLECYSKQLSTLFGLNELKKEHVLQNFYEEKISFSSFIYQTPLIQFSLYFEEKIF